jgi:hypothetical protein
MRPGHGKRLVLLLWTLVALFYFYLAYDYIRVTEHDREFAEYLQRVVQSAGVEQRSTKDIRELLLAKARELSLPLRGDQIEVKGGSEGFDVGVHYSVDIEFPLLQRQIYMKKFEHNEKYRPPQ